MAAHTGWIVTEDLRDTSVEGSHLGAVSPSMTAEAYLRLADAASREESDLTPLMHRITTKGGNGPERFLRDPRLMNAARRSTAGQALAPVLSALGTAWPFLRRTGQAAVNALSPRTRTARPPRGRAIGFPHQHAAPRPDRPGRNENAAPPTQTPPMTNRDRTVQQENAAKPVNDETPAMWERAYTWTIEDAAGRDLFRGQSIGVEGEGPEAARARRAPLEEIPGLPRDARIRWSGQPNWDHDGVSAGSAARSVAHVATGHLRSTWAQLREMGHDVAVVTRGDRPDPPATENPRTEPATPSPVEEALARMRARHGDPDATDIEAALARVRERVAARDDAQPRQQPGQTPQQEQQQGREQQQQRTERRRRYDEPASSVPAPTAPVMS